MADWISFWDTEHSIYVNARHRDVHYRTIAEHIDAMLALPAGHAREQGRDFAPVILDYGCGEALYAHLVARKARRLILCEAAPTVRKGLAERYAGDQNIQVCAPEDVAGMPEGSIDIIVMHSVLQYLTPEEADALFAHFRRLLTPRGHFFLGDVIPPDLPPSIDVLALLRFARANGFLLAALRGLVRTAFSNYPRLRSTLGLARYSEAAITAKLAAAGFSATRSPANIGHNPVRMTFLARPA
ncbi:MAG: methyltransferase domain-containing protein [Rhizobiales bacterium]|nr:methyltransferase domain-containing protein [Hyphomicrobiales bacterium]